jgi:hypothetical protein
MAGNALEVEVPGRRGLEVLFWAAGGKWWFLSSVTPANGECLLTNRVTLLGVYETEPPLVLKFGTIPVN